VVKKLDHVAMVVSRLEEWLELFRHTLGLVPSRIETFPQFGVRVALVPVGEVILEFMEPTNAATDMARFLKEKGEGIHHLCFEVADVDREMKELMGKGVSFAEKEPRQAIMGKVVFLHPQSTRGLLLQLCQKT